ncbi:hypothetical protein JMJ35_006129 [Cladonia borealis]|uniref:Uncharacterized protein n=1 Tax=Cladonia borealis TaxID=184061 RepID=A0AA39U9P8_9LECA|nr:hypothetical protein JMJ35_006129 [Cladonia borealis]
MAHFSSPKHNLISVLVVLAQVQTIVAQACHFTDGSEALAYTVCNGTANVSHCCTAQEACLTNGLCYDAADQSINVGTCTDPSWSNTNCFQYCPNTTSFRNPSTNTLYRCGGLYWCCSAGGNGTTCCEDPDVSYISDGLDLPALIFNGSAWPPDLTLAPDRTLSTSLSGTTTSATACSNSTDTIRQTVTSSCSPISTGGAIGVGLGIGIILMALGSVTSLLFLEKRKYRKLRQDTKNSHQTASNNQVNAPILLPNNIVERQMLPSNTVADMQPIRSIAK